MPSDMRETTWSLRTRQTIPLSYLCHDRFCCLYSFINDAKHLKEKTMKKKKKEWESAHIIGEKIVTSTSHYNSDIKEKEQEETKGGYHTLPNGK